MTTKSGIRIIRHMMLDFPMKYRISTNLEWNNMYLLPSGIAVKKASLPINETELIEGMRILWRQCASKRRVILTGITA